MDGAHECRVRPWPFALASGNLERWSTRGFAAAAPGVVDACLASFQQTSISGYVGCGAALADADFRGRLAKISCPVLAISGSDDPVCPPSGLEAIAANVLNGRHISLPGRHIVNIESAKLFNDALRRFLASRATSKSADTV